MDLVSHQVEPPSRTSSGARQPPCPRAGENFLYAFKGARQRAGRLAARLVLGALPRTGIGCELGSPGWPSGATGPRGLSPLPVRPLRLRPVTATADRTGKRDARAPPVTSWPLTRPPPAARAGPPSGVGGFDALRGLSRA